MFEGKEKCPSWKNHALAILLCFSLVSPREAGRERGRDYSTVVHDYGSQFVSGEWRLFITATGLTDIRTRVAHPESNGRVERLHRTHREEGLVDVELTDYGPTIDALTRWAHYYNYERPHASLAYLRPIDYYRGDPQARLAERERKLTQAREARKAYWHEHDGGPGGRNLSQN